MPQISYMGDDLVRLGWQRIIRISLVLVGFYDEINLGDLKICQPDLDVGVQHQILQFDLENLVIPPSVQG